MLCASILSFFAYWNLNTSSLHNVNLAIGVALKAWLSNQQSRWHTLTITSLNSQIKRSFPDGLQPHNLRFHLGFEIHRVFGLGHGLWPLLATFGHWQEVHAEGDGYSGLWTQLMPYHGKQWQADFGIYSIYIQCIFNVHVYSFVFVKFAAGSPM